MAPSSQSHKRQEMVVLVRGAATAQAHRRGTRPLDQGRAAFAAGAAVNPPEPESAGWIRRFAWGYGRIASPGLGLRCDDKPGERHKVHRHALRRAIALQMR
jgi:hypothetical protein